MMIRSFAAAVVGCALVPVLSGCGGRSYGTAEAKVESLNAARNSVESANAQIEKVLVSLGKVVSTANTDPRPAYDEFEDNLMELDSMRETARARAEGLREQSAEYFAKWQQETAGVTSPELRQLNVERMAKAKQTFKKVQDQAAEVSGSYQSFSDNIHEIQRYLGNNLNASGIEQAKPIIAKAEESGKAVRQEISKLSAELDRIAADLAPARPQGAPPPSSPPVSSS